MALVKTTIKNELKQAFTAVMNQSSGRGGAIDTVADKLADAIINAIKSQQITHTTGLVAPSGGGAVTGVLDYTIS